MHADFDPCQAPKTPQFFALPLGRSLTTILFPSLSFDLLVRLPRVSQPYTERGCLLPLDFPRPPKKQSQHDLSVKKKMALWPLRGITTP